eukprot:6213588-Pleurochrysis_carterae.AAC.11
MFSLLVFIIFVIATSLQARSDAASFAQSASFNVSRLAKPSSPRLATKAVYAASFHWLISGVVVTGWCIRLVSTARSPLRRRCVTRTCPRSASSTTRRAQLSLQCAWPPQPSLRTSASLVAGKSF